MKLVALEIPDKPSELAAWLDRQIVGDNLAALVAELGAIHRNPPGAGAEAIKDVLGTHRAAVLNEGLAALPHDRLKALLVHPRRLLELQELAIFAGGNYWRTLRPETPAELRQVDQDWKKLDAFLKSGTTDAPILKVVPRPVAFHRRPWVVSLATAAAVLAAVVAYERQRGPTVVGTVAGDWGWCRPGALPTDVTRAQYLDRLADEANEWFRVRPIDPASLARRILQFRQGCTILIFARHAPLSNEDREWLVTQCRDWASRLDKHLTDVEGGQTLAQGRDAVDRTIREVVNALRQRAKTG
jgi:hypothetical protein